MGKVYLIFISLMVAVTAQSVLASKEDTSESRDYKVMAGYQSEEVKK